MAQPKRATVYFEPELHKALKLKAIEGDRSISEIVNESVRAILLEDAVDLETIKKRKKEPVRSFEAFVKELKQHGSL